VIEFDIRRIVHRSQFVQWYGRIATIQDCDELELLAFTMISRRPLSSLSETGPAVRRVGLLLTNDLGEMLPRKEETTGSLDAVISRTTIAKKNLRPIGIESMRSCRWE